MNIKINLLNMDLLGKNEENGSSYNVMFLSGNMNRNRPSS